MGFKCSIQGIIMLYTTKCKLDLLYNQCFYFFLKKTFEVDNLGN